MSARPTRKQLIVENEQLRITVRQQANEIVRLSSGDPTRRLTERQIFEGYGVSMKAGKR